MKIITAIENNKINEKLKKIKEIEILNPDIQYREGILEYLEKNKDVEIIIMKENLQGQILIKELINEILRIKKDIRIIIFAEKNIKNKNIEKNKINNKKIKYIITEKINEEEILKIIKIKRKKQLNNVIIFLGNRGSGKSIILHTIIYFLIKNKNKKILIVDEDENRTLSNLYCENINFQNIENNQIIKIEKNLYLFNHMLCEKEKTEGKLRKIQNNFDYIFIDTSSNNILKKYKNIINKKIIIIEPNIFELRKIKEIYKETEKEDKKTEIILNKININSVSASVIAKIFNKSIIGKINYSKKITLIINENFNFKFLNNTERNKILKIIERI